MFGLLKKKEPAPPKPRTKRTTQTWERIPPEKKNDRDFIERFLATDKDARQWLDELNARSVKR